MSRVARPIGNPQHRQRYSAVEDDARATGVDLVEIFRASADDLLESGDARLALERAFRWGYESESGEHVAGLQQLMQELAFQRDRLSHHIEDQSFLGGIAPELDDIEQLERQGGKQSRTQPGHDESTTPIERIADRLEHRFTSDDAQQKFTELMDALFPAHQEAAGMSAREGAPERHLDGTGNTSPSPAESRRRSLDRIVEMLFSGGTEQAGGGQRISRHGGAGNRLNELAQDVEADLLALSEYQRLQRSLEELGDVGSVMSLAELDLGRLVDALPAEAADWLASWNDAISRTRSTDARGATGSGAALPPDVARAIGRDLLKGLFKVVRSPVSGDHLSNELGNAGDSAESSRPWESGHPLDLDLTTTVFNAVKRDPHSLFQRGILLHPDDFEVVERSTSTSLSTVLAIDRSRSMGQNGGWTSAKRIGLALHELIRQSYPRDSLDLLAFSSKADAVAVEELPLLTWDQFEHGTHLQAALARSRAILRRRRGGTRQIVLVTDGEPTLATINGVDVFSSPPDDRVIQATLAEVLKCTRDSIIINIVMLQETPAMRDFVQEIVRYNKGRVFQARPDTLGAFLLQDYVEQ